MTAFYVAASPLGELSEWADSWKSGGRFSLIFRPPVLSPQKNKLISEIYVIVITKKKRKKKKAQEEHDHS